jgi:uncharacterized protein (TIGR02246 family)
VRPLLAILLLALPHTVAADPAADVRALIDRQVKAWNRGDLEAFCAVYAQDAVFLSPSGLTRGRRAVLDRYRARYPDAAAMGRLAIEPIEVRTTAGAASMAARWRIAREDQPEASGLTLIVLHARPGGGYEIVQDASM